MSLRARALVLGLDGADVDVIQGIGATRLPTLYALMARGAWARLESVMPPATLPNWTTFLTGDDPGRHGVFDFTTRRGYQVRFTGGTVRETPTIAARLDRLGKRCAVIGFPATWPPERLSQGIFLSGWDAPVAFEADASFVWPPGLHAELLQRFGERRFDDVDEFNADAPGWHRGLAEKLEARIQRKVELAHHLLDRGPWDLFACYFGESDTGAHHLWAHHDPRSPRRPAEVTRAEGEGLTRVYAALDRAVAELVAHAGGDEVEVTIVSDHGSGGSSDVVLYLNRVLADGGLATLRDKGGPTLPVARLKDAALRFLPAKARERLFELGDGALPGMLESRVRFGALDMKRTRAFSDELNYFPAIHLNVRGREPDGTVDPSEVPALQRELEELLFALRNPWTGEPVVARVMPRESLFTGPLVDRAPDLLLDLHLDRGYSYNLQPTASAPRGAGAFRRLGPGEYLGRKGRSLAGSHRSHGLFIAAGPRVRAVGEIRAHIADASATVVARLGVAPHADARGRVLREILSAEDGEQSTPSPDLARTQSRLDPGDEAKVEARLRALGYID